MTKNLLKIGVAASLAVAAVPLVAAYAEGESTGSATTHVRIGVATSVACSSIGDNETSDISLGTNVAPGTLTPTVPFVITGATNSLLGFTITGTPTSLVHASGTEAAGPKIIYKYGESLPEESSWWVETSESSNVSIGATIVLTSTQAQKDFDMGAAANINDTQFAGEYAGQISWVCAVQ